MFKTINNIFYEKNTALGIFFLSIEYLVLPLIILVEVIFQIVPKIEKWINKDLNLEINLILGLVAVPVFLTALFLYKKRFGIHKNMSNNLHYLKTDLLYLGIIISFIIVYSFFQFIANKIDIKLTKECFLSSFGTALLAGVSEEIFFRGILISYLQSRFSTKQTCNFLIILISSLLFAVGHFANLSFESFWGGKVIQQVISCFCMGILLGSLYLKTSHLSICFFIHFIWDLFIYLSGNLFDYSSGKIITPVIFLLFDVFIGLFGFFMLKKD